MISALADNDLMEFRMPSIQMNIRVNFARPLYGVVTVTLAFMSGIL